MTSPTRPLLIGVSARIYYPGAPVLDLGGIWTKTLHYMEQSVARWLLRDGALPVMIPAVERESLAVNEPVNLLDYAQALDGLLLQGGNDVAPETYGEQPLNPKWAGDTVRDRYEMGLIEAFMAAGKPVFGICRGLQILNVAFGGTLYQDLPTQLPRGSRHLAESHYEHNVHRVDVVPGGWLANLHPDAHSLAVNSIHHQAIKDLAPGLRVEAYSSEDQVIEAVSRPGPSFVAGVQWHPEFPLRDADRPLDDQRMLRSFLAACLDRREQTSP